MFPSFFRLKKCFWRGISTVFFVCLWIIFRVTRSKDLMRVQRARWRLLLPVQQRSFITFSRVQQTLFWNFLDDSGKGTGRGMVSRQMLIGIGVPVTFFGYRYWYRYRLWEIMVSIRSNQGVWHNSIKYWYWYWVSQKNWYQVSDTKKIADTYLFSSFKEIYNQI